MLYDCRVYDKYGALVQTHTAAELEERARVLTLPTLEPREVSVIERFEQCEIEEYTISLPSRQ